MSSTGRPRRPSRRIVITSLVTTSISVVLHLFAQAGMLFTRPDWVISSFRGYFPFDQLSYLSMVTNAATGNPSFTEPFSLTGANHYPHAWYVVLGLVARLLDLSSSTVWQLGGLFVQTVLVATISVVVITLTRSPWLGLLAPVPFLLGTFTFLRTGGWYTTMESHAVLWGPFGVFFTLNGEAASLCLASIAILALNLVWARRTSARSRLWVSIAASAVIGALANVQTYSFITAVYLICFVAAAWALIHHRQRIAGVVSLMLIPVLFLLGPTVEDRAGQLPALVFGLLPAFPGLVVILAKNGPRLLLYFGAAVVAASPQVITTVTGILGDDPFLDYRVASNQSLGVEPAVGLLSSVALLLPLVLLASIGVWRRRPLWVAFPSGAVAAWAILASNDRWGANAEPYRLWIDSFALIAISTLPLLASAVRSELTRRGPDGGPERHDGSPEEISTTDERGLRDVRSRLGFRLVVWAVVVVALGAGASGLDWVKFWSDNRSLPLFQLSGGYAQALGASADDAVDGSGMLVAQAPCIDPQFVKANSAAPVAFYNLGLAWPERRDEVQAYLTDRGTGDLDLATLRSADIGWLMTDTACSDGWADRLAASGVVPTTSHEYENGLIELWRLP